MILDGATHRFTSTSAIMASTAWMHIAVTARAGDGSAAKLYQNGIQLAAAWTLNNGNVTLDNNLYEQTIGCFGPYNGAYLQFWEGQLDDIIFFNTALTPNEVRFVYEQGRGGGMLREPPKRRSFFVPTLPLPVRRRSSRFLTFPG